MDAMCKCGEPLPTQCRQTTESRQSIVQGMACKMTDPSMKPGLGTRQHCHTSNPGETGIRTMKENVFPYVGALSVCDLCVKTCGMSRRTQQDQK
jgi:hypothetical protein